MKSFDIHVIIHHYKIAADFAYDKYQNLVYSFSLCCINQEEQLHLFERLFARIQHSSLTAHILSPNPYVFVSIDVQIIVLERTYVFVIGIFCVPLRTAMIGV